VGVQASWLWCGLNRLALPPRYGIMLVAAAATPAAGGWPMIGLTCAILHIVALQGPDPWEEAMQKVTLAQNASCLLLAILPLVSIVGTVCLIVWAVNKISRSRRRPAGRGPNRTRF